MKSKEATNGLELGSIWYSINNATIVTACSAYSGLALLGGGTAAYIYHTAPYLLNPL